MVALTSLASTTVFKNPILETASLSLATLAVRCCLLRGLPFFFIHGKRVSIYST